MDCLVDEKKENTTDNCFTLESVLSSSNLAWSYHTGIL